MLFPRRQVVSLDKDGSRGIRWQADKENLDLEIIWSKGLSKFLISTVETQ